MQLDSSRASPRSGRRGRPPGDPSVRACRRRAAASASTRRYGRRMAHPGDLDTSFGSGGRKTVNFGGIDAARAVLVQPNGRVLAAGGGGPTSSFCVVRLRSANGTLDPTFGSGGKRLIDFGTDDESVPWRGAAGRRQDPARRRLAPAARRRAPEGQRCARHDVRRRRQEALQLGRDRTRHRRGRGAERQDPARRLLGPRGRQHPGRANEGQRRPGHDLRDRRDRERSTSAAPSSARRWHARPTGASWSPDGRRPAAPWSHGCGPPGSSIRTSAATAA